MLWNSSHFSLKFSDLKKITPNTCRPLQHIHSHTRWLWGYIWVEIQAVILGTAMYTPLGFNPACFVFMIHMEAMGLITGIKSVQFTLFFSFAVCPHFSSHQDLLENEEMRKEAEAPGGGITFNFPGVRVPHREHGTWGVSTFLSLSPFVCNQLSYPLFSICSAYSQSSLHWRWYVPYLTEVLWVLASSWKNFSRSLIK